MSTNARWEDLNSFSLIKFALKTRLLFIILQTSANFFVSDHVPDAFESPLANTHDGSNQSGALDKLILLTLKGFHHWDAQYFLHVAHYGYTYENALAFFPFFPLCIRYLAVLFTKLSVGVITLYPAYLVASTMLNVLTFTVASVALFQLGQTVLHDKVLAYRAALLFCLSPATIFFIAPYTESCFSMFSFLAMLYFQENQIIISSVFIGFAAVTRSNGLVLIGLIAYWFLRNFFIWFRSATVFTFLRLCFKTCLTFAISVLPFALFQYYAYSQFCYRTRQSFPDEILEQATEKHLILAGNEDNSSSPWCHYALPISYSYVQDHYWDVGFIRYYQPKQIPNFLLASPVLYLVFSYLATYLQKNAAKGLEMIVSKTTKLKPGLFSPLCAVYAIHAGALAVFCSLCIHIQVSTRLLASSSPVLYWYVAWLTSGNKRPTHISLWPEDNSATFYCRTYFLGYVVLGFVLFCNNFPWT